MYLFVGPLLAGDKSETNSCRHKGKELVALIQGNKITPDNIQAKKCDTLTIVNKDAPTRLMAFGEHDHHIIYGGISEYRLSTEQKFTVTLDKTGTYLIHDHFDESVAAHFTVND